MDFGVLGPLAVWEDGRELRLGPAKQRAVLAALLLHANDLVPTARLVDELWGEQPPPSAVKAVQVYVSRLRKVLGEGAIETRPAGYVMLVEEGTLDLRRFERLLEQGRALLAGGSADEAAGVLRSALALWRGPALADVQYEAFARNEIERLEELRLVALTQRLEADLALGRQDEIVPELEALVREHPLRESLRELLIVAAASHEDLPTGTVTFLFTDVEGSTELLGRLGKSEYAALLDEHRSLLRSAFADAGGREVDTQGDAFFVAFRTASRAIQAAARAQRDLVATPLAARIGIHTGEPAVGPTGYVGLDVSRAARICSAGHGGQVVISQATRELVEAELTDGVELRDLGEHRLKDLTRPQRLSQLVIVGLANEFPALRTLENRPTNLPVQLTPLVGRERELTAVAEQLRREDVRLLTLTGTGGAGKTRLGLQAAGEVIEDFPQGVFFVALAPLTDPALVLPTIAQTLGLRESAAVSFAESLTSHLAPRRLLLLLDNFEHVIDAAPELADLLTAAPQLTLLVTSRVPLHLSGEHEYPVPPLELPDPARLPPSSTLSQYEAVALFIERARAVKAGFVVTNTNAPAIAEICVRLDGLPLAIELAAARAKLLSPRALLGRLEQRLDLLTGGPRDVPARQQTLRATIDWSYDLLGPGEQTHFARLAAFAGGCTLPAAEAVCGDNGLLTGLAALIDNNMLRQEEQPDGEPRFRMLETIRAYALERLEASGEADEIRRRHAMFFVAAAEQIFVDFLDGDVDWLLRDADLDNFRAALTELVARDDRESTVRLVWGFQWYLGYRGQMRELAQWCEEAVRVSADLPPALRGRALESAAIYARKDDPQRASELAQGALDAFRQAGEPERAAWSVRQLALIAWQRGDVGGSDALYEQAAELFQQLDDALGLNTVTHDQGLLAMHGGDYARSRALLEESLAQARELGRDQRVGNAQLDLGVLALCEGRYDDAVPLFVESLESSLRHSFPVNVGLSLRGLAACAAVRGKLESSARILGAAETLEDETGDSMDEYERLAYAGAMAPVLERADEPDIAAAREAGRAMSESDAAAYALATVARQPLVSSRR